MALVLAGTLGAVAGGCEIIAPLRPLPVDARPPDASDGGDASDAGNGGAGGAAGAGNDGGSGDGGRGGSSDGNGTGGRGGNGGGNGIGLGDGGVTDGRAGGDLLADGPPDAGDAGCDGDATCKRQHGEACLADAECVTGSCASGFCSRGAFFREFNLPHKGVTPFAITLGVNGDVWFAEWDGAAIGVLNAEGGIGVFPTGGKTPLSIARAPDGNIWFTDPWDDSIGCVTREGQVTRFPLPGAVPTGITRGRDGNMWFTEYYTGKVGRARPVCQPAAVETIVTEFFLLDRAGGPSAIGPGLSYDIWVGQVLRGKLARLSAQSPDDVREVDAPSGGTIDDIAVSADGQVWMVSQDANWIAHLTGDGKMVGVHPIPTPDALPRAITIGRDGNVWFTESNGNKIGRLTPTGRFDEWRVPTSDSGPGDLVADDDGNIWFTESRADKIGRFTP